MRLELGLAGVVLGLLFGCNPEKPATESAEARPPASASTGVAAAADAAPAVPGIETWSGTYVSTAGSVYVFDAGEYAGVKWRGDEAGAGLGEGPASLTVDRQSGAVHGTAGGPIGDVVLSGSFSGDTLTASVLRKDPLDRGLTGTLIAKKEGDRLVGAMRLSVANARVIREATVTLSREKR